MRHQEFSAEQAQLNFTAPRKRASAHCEMTWTTRGKTKSCWASRACCSCCMSGVGGKEEAAFAASWGCPPLNLQLSWVYPTPSQAATEAEGTLAFQHPTRRKQQRRLHPTCGALPSQSAFCPCLRQLLWVLMKISLSTHFSRALL